MKPAKSSTQGRKQTLEASQRSPEPAPKPASYYAEEADLEEPDVQQVEHQIQQDLQAGFNGPSKLLSLDMVLQHHALDEGMVHATPEDRSHFFQHLTHLRLDRMHLGGDLPASLLSSLPCLTHVYLQHNHLTGMAGLAALPVLRFAALSHNRINKVEGISKLPHLMFLDLSYNQLQQVEVQQLPRSVCFLKVASNPCTAKGVRSLQEDLQAHLPRLRDLDESDSEDDVGDSEEGSGKGSDNVCSNHGEGVEGLEQQGYEGEGDALPQISEEGLPGYCKAKGSGSSSSVGLKELVEGMRSDLQGKGGHGRLVHSALDMLDELERACYSKADDAASSSLRMSMSRAMGTVADHPAMRASWHRAAGSMLVGAGAREGDSRGDIRPVSGRAGTTSNGGKDALLRPGSSINRGDMSFGSGWPADLFRSSSSSMVLKGPLSGDGLVTPAPPSTKSLRPVTPLEISLARSRNHSAHLESLDRYLASVPLPLAPGRPLSSSQPQQQQRGDIQQYVDADLDVLRKQLQEFTEPLSAATAHRLPGSSIGVSSPSANVAVGQSGRGGTPSSSQDVIAQPDGPAATDRYEGTQGDVTNYSNVATAKLVTGKHLVGARGRSTRGGLAGKAAGGQSSGSEAGGRVGKGGAVAKGRGVVASTSSSNAGRGRATAAGRGGGLSGRGEKPDGKGAGRGEGAAGGQAVGQRAEASAVKSRTGDSAEALKDPSSEESAVQAAASGSRPTSAASAGRTLLYSASIHRPPSGGQNKPASITSPGSRPISAQTRPGSATSRPGGEQSGSARPERSQESANGQLKNTAEVPPVPGRSGAGNSRPSSARPGSGNSADKGANAPVGSIVAAAECQSRTWLREELERKMGAAAARLKEQRVQQEALSAAIRGLRSGESQVSTLAELRSNFSLHAAMEAGSGATEAVRAALFGPIRSSPNSFQGGGGGSSSSNKGGLVKSALQEHAAGVAASTFGIRAAVLADQDHSLRSSLSRLDELTTATKAAFALRQGGGSLEEQQSEQEDVQGQYFSEMSGDDDMDAGEANFSHGGSSGSKYFHVIRARAQARKQQAAIYEDEEEAEREG